MPTDRPDYAPCDHCGRDYLAPPADPLAEALESERLRAALDTLTAKLDEVHASDAYRGIWVIAHAHGMQYSGPTYTAELDAAQRALAASPADPTPIRRLLAALARLEDAVGGDGAELNAAIEELLAAGREVRGVLGGEVER